MFPEYLKEFRDYVHSFYGKGGIYDLGCGMPDIEKAVLKYASYCLVNLESVHPPAWGGGDSLDRERVRYILEDYGFEEISEKYLTMF